MQPAMEGWSTVSAGLASASVTMDTLRSYLDPIKSHPLFVAALAIPGLNLVAIAAMLLSEAENPVIEELWAAGSTVVGWLGATGASVWEVGKGIVGLVAGGPPGLILRGIFTAVSRLPECYQVPIIDLVLAMSLTAAMVFTIPLAALGPIPGAASHVVTSFYAEIGGLSPADKMVMLQRLADLLSFTTVVDFGLGLAVGAVEGVWDGVVGLAMLAAGAVAMVVGIPLALAGILPTLGAAAALWARAQRDRAESADLPEVAPVQEPAIEAPEVAGSGSTSTADGPRVTEVRRTSVGLSSPRVTRF